MSGKVKINEAHPKYSEYVKKFETLWDTYEKKIEKEEAKYPNWRPRVALDHPATGETVKLERQRNAELRKLKEEYSYLFTEAAEGEEE